MVGSFGGKSANNLKNILTSNISAVGNTDYSIPGYYCYMIIWFVYFKTKTETRTETEIKRKKEERREEKKQNSKKER